MRCSTTELHRREGKELKNRRAHGLLQLERGGKISRKLNARGWGWVMGYQLWVVRNAEGTGDRRQETAEGLRFVAARLPAGEEKQKAEMKCRGLRAKHAFCSGAAPRADAGRASQPIRHSFIRHWWVGGFVHRVHTVHPGLRTNGPGRDGSPSRPQHRGGAWATPHALARCARRLKSPPR